MKIDLDFDISENIRGFLKLLHDNGGSPRFVGGLVRDELGRVLRAVSGVIPEAKLSGIHGSRIKCGMTSEECGMTSEESENDEEGECGMTNASPPQTDIDIATKLKPDELMGLFRRNKIKYIDIGSQFGTVIAVIDGRNIEITTLRLDIDCDGRHAKVKFTDNFEEDAKRRDFTINAMSYCPFEGELFDYFGGLADLKSGIVRFIGDPDQRIKEDYLRILRFFRFSDRYAKELHEASYEACIRYFDSITTLSVERILSELTLMISSMSAAKIYAIMDKAGLLEKIFHEAELDFRLLGLMGSRDSNLRFAALLNKVQEAELKSLLKSLKFSNHNSSKILELVRFRNLHGSLVDSGAENLRPIFFRLWVDGMDVNSHAEISGASKDGNFAAIEEFIASNEKPKFPIDGNDLIKLGLKGHEISKALDQLKDDWVSSSFKMNKEELLVKLRRA